MLKINLKPSGIARAIGYLLCGAIVLSESPVAATIVEYDVKGTVRAPINSSPLHSGGFFTLDVGQGNLVLRYNDNDTTAVFDDIVTMTGVTPGCVIDCNNPITEAASYGLYPGSGDFEWDFTLKNPLTTQNQSGHVTTGPDEFVFSQQNAGTLTLLDPPSRVLNVRGRGNSFYGPFPAVTTLTAKNDKDFAFAIFDDPNSDDLIGVGWIVLMNGFIGDITRFEFGPNNAVLNWDLRLVRRGTPPTGEVPEPATVGLLSLGLFAGFRARRAKSVPH